ncbi:YbaB/EbfC family nucleoid-associated protein [Rhodococcus sp. NPDC127528]|uniref:YbaB/EbfC family nucleoid-associated protein n=1 Tax=unclassified Rhodococcus (in: high G+C Gram-positive bacteria) TaxID=192944 RepID=UPI00362EC8A2
MSEIDGVVARASHGVENLEQALHGLTTLRARATHESGLVRVEVDEQGGLRDLWIAEGLARVDARDLGHAVVEAAAAAAEIVAGRRDQILASLRDALTY